MTKIPKKYLLIIIPLVLAISTSVWANKEDDIPVAFFTANPNIGTAPLTVHLDASSSQASKTNHDRRYIVEYQWLSSNNQAAYGPQHFMIFETPGQYTIILTITNDKDRQDTFQQTVTVSDTTADPLLYTQADLNAAKAETRQECRNDPASCGISVGSGGEFSQADLDIAYEAGRQSCISDPTSCGISIPGVIEDIGYNTAKRIGPQVIMAGVSPSIIDLNDTEFSLVALVRPGILPIQGVSLMENGEQTFNFGMTRVSIFSNGDEIWHTSILIERGSLGESEIPISWGEEQGQYAIFAVDSGGQMSDIFPTIKSGNYPEQ
jgi:PKD repeat protein